MNVGLSYSGKDEAESINNNCF